MPASDTPELPFDGPRRWKLARADTPAAPAVPVQSPPPALLEKLELFQSAAPGTEQGYQSWKAEVAAARQAELDASRAGELPAAYGGTGYSAWKAEAEAARRTFEQRWGVPLGRAVRLQLRGEPQEREGLLHLADDVTARTSESHLWLRVGSHRFAASQIESLVRL